jgi:hypothetical protein
MRQSLIAFAAVYAIVLGTSSCSSNNTTLPGGGQGQYQQIERLARPAVKELFQQFSNHDTTNRTSPYAQPYSSQTLYQEIGSFTTNVAGRPTVAAALQTILIPDVVTADLSNTTDKASYLGVETGGATGGKFGGRSLTDDVIDISLGAVFGNTLPALGVVAEDNKEVPCLTTDNVSSQAAKDNVTLTTFPYVGAPH